MTRASSRALVRVCRYLVAVASLVAIAGVPGALAGNEPQIAAQYAVVVDADTGQVLYSKAMDAPAAPASLTKIFTAAVALNSDSPDRRLTVDAYDLVGEASMGLRAGEQISLRTLLYGMMLPSGNDAAMTTARGLGELPGDSPQQSIDRFMERVNNTGTRIGLRNTKLLNPHGLDQPGHQSSARDIAAMTMYALRNPEFRQIIGAPYYRADGHELYQVNQLVSSYRGLVGGKTGVTDLAGYCLVEVAQRNGHTVIAVLMKSTADAWYGDATKLLDFGFGALTAGAPSPTLPKITLAPATESLGTVPAPAQPDSSTANLKVDQLDEQTVVVRHPDVASDRHGISWRWPVASLASMALVFALVVNYPALMAVGSLVLRNRPTIPRRSLAFAFAGSTAPRSSVSRRHGRHRAARRHGGSRSRRHAQLVSVSAGRQANDFAETRDWVLADNSTVVAMNDAGTIASRAVRLAKRGEYLAASSEFARALQCNPNIDLTRCDDFWGMQPAGYVAAAKAYLAIDRPADARSLLTVVKLSCGSHRELERLLAQVSTLVRA